MDDFHLFVGLMVLMMFGAAWAIVIALIVKGEG